MQLYLIRHGKTEANEKHLYCGSTDLPLSKKGAEELKGLSYSVPDDVKYLTSGMQRAEQTLRILFGEVEHSEDRRFREMDFGAFEMHSYEELKDRPDYQVWISGDNEANVCPGGESGNQMKQRVIRALQEWMSEKIVLVAHGGTIAIIMDYLFQEEGRNRYSWQPRPGYGYMISEKGYVSVPDMK